MDFHTFFKKATDKEPFPYQHAFAVSSSLPHILEAPTGSGKTATVIIGWLWRFLHAPREISGKMPRRLVYCLPMRVLVEQTYDNAAKWLSSLNLADKIGLHLLMGGEDADDWDLYPEQPAIIIGTQDMLLSRALNRGYGMSRYRWPMAFGLLNNDCLWVFDEVQLMGSGLATTTQLHAFRKQLGTAGFCASVWMSATLKEEWLNTIDFAKWAAGAVIKAGLSKADKEHEHLRKRLEAAKPLYASRIPVSRPDRIADAILSAHKPGSLTLVVVNTIKRAVDLYRAISKDIDARTSVFKPDLILIHSRFRPPDRRHHIDQLLAEPSPSGLIAITTQVVEAGVDVDARTLFTELAPWSSLVQRFGRCNRTGAYSDAAVYWIDIFNVKPTDAKGKKRSKRDLETEIESNFRPYDKEELTAAVSQLREMENVSIAELEAHVAGLDAKTLSALFPYDPQHVIRRKDMIELFDTTPDLAGNDIDVSRFIREGDDLDAQVFWRKVPENGPTNDELRPDRAELCSVRTNNLREFAREKHVYQWDFLDERWRPVTAREIFPGHTYLIPSNQGGYHQSRGWDAKSNEEVSVIQSGQVIPDSDGMDARSRNSPFERIHEHTEKVVEGLSGILWELQDLLTREIAAALQIAARWHDRGKSHEVFQHAIEPDDDHHSGCWAKAPKMHRYGRKGFRHELASALAMIHEELPDLACYLVAAHHGKVRVSIRSLPHEKRPASTRVRFARGIWDGDTLPELDLGNGVIAPGVTMSLEPMELGLSPAGQRSWVERILVLRDDRNIGPFRLAFLEVILRSADMRASTPANVAKKEDTDA